MKTIPQAEIFFSKQFQTFFLMFIFVNKLGYFIYFFFPAKIDKAQNDYVNFGDVFFEKKKYI